MIKNNQSSSAFFSLSIHYPGLTGSCSLWMSIQFASSQYAHNQPLEYSSCVVYICDCKCACGFSRLTVVLVSLISFSLFCLLAGERDPGLCGERQEASSKLPSVSKLSSVSISQVTPSLSLVLFHCVSCVPSACLPALPWWAVQSGLCLCEYVCV